MRNVILIALGLYVLDQLTKAWIVSNFFLGEVRPVIAGFFDLVYVANTGAAFGMFQQFPWFFTVLKCLALIVIIYLFASGRLKSFLARSIGTLLLAGVAGNLTDRFIHGYVVDFLSFDLHVPFANPWPSFNVADCCITVAAVLMFVYSLTTSGNDKKKAADENSPAT